MTEDHQPYWQHIEGGGPSKTRASISVVSKPDKFSWAERINDSLLYFQVHFKQKMWSLPVHQGFNLDSEKYNMNLQNKVKKSSYN